MTQGERRRRRCKKIKQRVRLEIDKHSGYMNSSVSIDEIIPVPSKYTNNNYINGINGLPRKTNIRKRHSNYRRKGSWGKDMEWKPHDKKQIEDMNQQMNEVNHD